MKKFKVMLSLILVFSVIMLFSACSTTAPNTKTDIQKDTASEQKTQETETKEVKKIKVIATLFPTYDFAKQIVGDKGEVVLLTGPAIEPHAYEPTPKDIIKIDESDVFIYTGEKMEPWVHDIVEGKTNFVVVDSSENIEMLEGHHHDHDEHDADHDHEHDADHDHEHDADHDHEHDADHDHEHDADHDHEHDADHDHEHDADHDHDEHDADHDHEHDADHDHEHDADHDHEHDADHDHEHDADHEHEHHHDHGGVDPHIWTDPVLAKTIVDNILTGVVKADPENKDFYTKNAENYKLELDKLDSEYKAVFKDKDDFVLVYGGHFALGYLAHRYDIKYLSAYKGFSPDAEPSPKDIAQLTEIVKENHVKAVYSEELVLPKVAEVISKGANVKLYELSGLHNVSKDQFEAGVTYIDVMKKNLENLKKGM